MTEIVLLAPGAEGASGAAWYNQRIVAALVALGHPARLVTLRGSYPAAVPELEDAAVVGGLPGDVCIVLDSMASALHRVRQEAALLVHRPGALQTLAGPHSTAMRQAELQALSRCRAVIATGADVAARLVADYGVGADRLATVPPGADVLARTVVGAAAPCLRLLSLGPLVPRRRHDVLLAALARLTDLDWTLAVHGEASRDPDYAAGLHRLAETLAPRVRFAGGEADWSQTDVLVLPLLASGGHAAVLQALGRGIPCVLGSDTPLAWPQEATVRVPAGDAETLSKVLRRLLVDAALRDALASAAWQAGGLLPDWRARAQQFRVALKL